MQLRDYQHRSIVDLRAAYAAGCRAPCLVLPTGGGKTLIAAEIIRLALSKGKRVLFNAGRVELLNQAIAKLAEAGITDVRLIRADADEGNLLSPITVASVPTLVTPKWRENLPEAELVVFDEVHHLRARGWEGIAKRYEHANLLGLTATPQRGDGKALGDVLDAIVVGATVKELTDRGHLVPCRVYAPSELLDSRKLALDPVDAYERYCEDMRTIVFCGTREHARASAEAFVARGIATGVVLGESKDRDETLAKLESGDIRVLVNVGVCVEGWDCPAAAATVFARRFNHVGGYLQAIGRVLRPSEGKTHARVVDLCGSALVHGTPDLDREYTLNGTGIRATDRQPIRQCQACGAVFTDRGECPYCGFAIPPLARAMPKSTDVGVSELAPKTPARPWYVTMPAKFGGTCKTCGSAIRKGDPIVWAKGTHPRHEACARRRAA